jgi:type IV pilus assembly protein PilA
MLSKLKNRKREGFTLIELMIVVAIIGILAAIAIPQFSSYRQRAYDAAAKSQLKNLATAQEDYYVENDTYLGITTATTGAITGLNGWTADGDVSVAATVATDGQSFTATAVHSKTKNTFTYDSEKGGMP